MSMEIGLGTPTGVRRTWHLSGVLALAGGALMVTGAFLPWLSVFEGLQTIRGVAGPNGRMLAIAVAGALLLGVVLAVRCGKLLGFAIAVLGAIAACFADYHFAHLLVTIEGLIGMVLTKLV